MVTDYDLSLVHTIVVGGAPIAQTTSDRLKTRFGTFGNTRFEIRQSKLDQIHACDKEGSLVAALVKF